MTALLRTNFSPFFQIARVVAAILRATVSLAIDSRIPDSTNESRCGLNARASRTAPLNTFFKYRLWFLFNPRVATGRRFCSSVSPSISQSEEPHVTTAGPQYAQSCRLVRNRNGVATWATIVAARIGPIPGTDFTKLHGRCFLASRSTAVSASPLRSSNDSICEYNHSARVLRPKD